MNQKIRYNRKDNWMEKEVLNVPIIVFYRILFFVYELVIEKSNLNIGLMKHKEKHDWENLPIAILKYFWITKYLLLFNRTVFEMQHIHSLTRAAVGNCKIYFRHRKIILVIPSRARKKTDEQNVIKVKCDTFGQQINI